MIVRGYSMNSLHIILAALAAVLLSGGCAPKGIRYNQAEFNRLKEPVDKQYIIGKEDVLKVTVYEKWPYMRENFVSTPVVREDGTIVLPPVGEVNVDLITVAKAESLITEKLGQFIRQPYCEITVEKQNSSKVYIFGDVWTAKIVGVRPGETVLDVLVEAGGRQIEKSYLGTIKLVRRQPDGVKVYDIEMNRVVHKGALDENVAVLDGDILYVPDRPLRDVQRVLDLVFFWVPSYFLARGVQNDVQNLSGSK
jgi:protein involved in polysaccharide export with SLBB domain